MPKWVLTFVKSFSWLLDLALRLRGFCIFVCLGLRFRCVRLSVGMACPCFKDISDAISERIRSHQNN